MSDDEITPAGVITAFWRWFWVGILSLALLSALILGGWRAGWWFAGQNVNRETRLLHNSYSFQSAQQADLSQKISDIAAETTQMGALARASQQYADLHAQRLGEAQLACADAAQITSIPSAQAGWVRANCSAGAVSPASPFEK